MKLFAWLIALASLAVTTLPAPVADAQTRIRDIVDVEGVRQNDLIGYGIVVGLNGTGDTVRNSPFTEDSLTYMLERLGVNVQGEDIKPDNVAAVLVTATLPAFARNGSSLDVSVASIGDAESLEGGTLILTPLKGADNEVNQRQSLTLALRDPDFTTAARIEDTINDAFGAPVAFMRDPGTVDLDLRVFDSSPARVLANIENLPIQVAVPARIVIDEQSGTIVLGEDVTISKVAIAQGNISIKVVETPVVSQPNPFSDGESIVLPRSQISIGQTGSNRIATLNPNVTLSQLIAGLNALGVSPQEMADIIRTMKTAGAIHADLIVR